MSKKKRTRPEWMKEKLKNETVDKILLACLDWITDGTIQIIYEYIKELEKKIYD